MIQTEHQKNEYPKINFKRNNQIGVKKERAYQRMMVEILPSIRSNLFDFGSENKFSWSNTAEILSLNLDEFILKYEDVRANLINRRLSNKGLSHSEQIMLKVLNDKLDELMPVDRPPGFDNAVAALEEAKRIFARTG